MRKEIGKRGKIHKYIWASLKQLAVLWKMYTEKKKKKHKKATVCIE